MITRRLGEHLTSSEIIACVLDNDDDVILRPGDRSSADIQEHLEVCDDCYDQYCALFLALVDVAKEEGVKAYEPPALSTPASRRKKRFFAPVKPVRDLNI